MEALQAATRDAARFLGREAETGIIVSGARADLVVLDANPLDDIRNTARVRAVVLKGEWLDRPVLDAMLARARQ